ncbi:MAG: lipoate--protein ligase [Treponema sp.]|jgi:lipoate-protein ligase A|nr:lipoate--protein ligase [Treponema sp.]
MIKRGFIVQTGETNPYRNIAREKLLLDAVPRETCILYLWQNRQTVVIGRNQNAWTECRVAELEGEGGFLARRLSGGGAVFHDLGNLNFTFLTPQEDYNLERQSSVILQAVRNLGIEAEMTGRNDIETGGRKFSGNAFYRGERNAYHHGTLLVRADIKAAGRYLSVSREKILSKGVESVRSRMVNLAECKPDITVPSLAASLRAAFAEVYRVKAEELSPEPLSPEPAPSLEDRFPGATARLAELTAWFSSPQWKYGKNPPFRFKAERRFSWGGADIRFDVERNRIAGAQIFSDAMDSGFILEAAEKLKDCPFEPRAVAEKLAAIDPAHRIEAADIAAMIFESGEGDAQGQLVD